MSSVAHLGWSSLYGTTFEEELVWPNFNGGLTLPPSLVCCTCISPVVSLYLSSPFPFPYAGGYRAFFPPSATDARAKWRSCLQRYGMRSSNMLPLSLANWRNEFTTRSVVHQLLRLYSQSRSHNYPDIVSSMSLDPSTCSLFQPSTALSLLATSFRGSASSTVLISTRGGPTTNQTLHLIPLLSRVFTFWPSRFLIGDQSANRLTCLISRSAGQPTQLSFHTDQLSTHFSLNSMRLGSALSRGRSQTEGVASIPWPSSHP